ncbi:MAG: ribose-5-phosphate isomerase RpiA [Euryarchaeota archaeon]|nr:ribose-5-phosphate isomerase RpiA [Euryarchaeota archaeon]
MGPSRVEKEAAGRSIAELVDNGMVVGLGTGTTVAYAIAHLGQRIIDDGLSIGGVPTSYQSLLLAVEHHVPIATLYEHAVLDLALDGADQIDTHLNVIKGGGGSHTREKIVASAARRFIIAVDSSKLAPHLRLPVPLEVMPFAYPVVMKELKKMRAGGMLRRSDGYRAFITDQGNFIVDADFGVVQDPEKLAKDLSTIPGVVEHGIFTNVSEVHVARADAKETCVEILKR